MAAVLPYVLGALGGSGVLCVIYGLKILQQQEAPERRRQAGYALVSLGLASVAISLYLIRRTA